MFQDCYPLFTRDMILKAEMLENITKYPRDMFRILFEKYSDGVISGAGIKVIEGTKIHVLPGIIKYKGVLYHLNEEKSFECCQNGEEQILKVRFLEREENMEAVKCCTELILEEAGEKREDEMELCRFILKNGAILRQDYQNFLDMATVHNTVNILNVPCAGIGMSTLSSEITQRFGLEMSEYELFNHYDAAFSMLCMQGQPVNRILIEKYISRRVEDSVNTSMSNEQIHGYLVKILENVRLGERGRGTGRGGRQRMLVD